MSKKFAEYSQFDLSKVNKDVLKKWDENQVFAKRYAGYSPRNGSFYQRYFLSLQNDEGLSGET